MLTLGIAALALSQQAPSAASIVSKMIARYHEADSMTGTIAMQQGLGTQTVSATTVLQYERPNKLYIKQTFKGEETREVLITCDGRYFSYNTPENLPGSENLKRLVEAVSTQFGTLDLGGVYAASSKPLLDRSVPLDLAISRKEDLTYRRNQWATLSYVGKTTLQKESVHRITGRYRPYGEADVTGTYEMYINEAGDLRRYTLTTQIQDSGRLMTVMGSWDVNLAVNGKPDASLFRLVR